MPAQTTLYSETQTEIVTLPAGYFVLLVDTVAPTGYIKVAYDDLIGYVAADSVKQVDYTPVTKYETTVRFSCDNDGQKVNVRAAPKRTADIVSTLDAGETGHSYGTVNGEALIVGAGTVWYYVSCNGTRGYVYYAHVSVEPTPPNVIEKEPDPEPEAPTDVTPTLSTDEQPMSTVAAIIFIVALCIPVPFIMFYLFKKPKEK